MNTIDPEPRLDVFEPDDNTALVCADVPELQRLIVEQLAGMNYKIHPGLSVDDLLLKLETHAYDLIVMSEHIGGNRAEENVVLNRAIQLPAAQRRRQLLVLIGAQLKTNDGMNAFEHSVDLVVSLSDVVHLRPLIRRAVVRMQEFYAPWFEAEKLAVQA